MTSASEFIRKSYNVKEVVVRVKVVESPIPHIASRGIRCSISTLLRPLWWILRYIGMPNKPEQHSNHSDII